MHVSGTATRDARQTNLLLAANQSLPSAKALLTVLFLSKTVPPWRS